MGVAGLLLVFASCGGRPSTSPTSTTSGTRVQMDLPISPGDSRNVAYGIWPFGVHGGGHALDGHPGFDVESAPGSAVLAAAEGRVDNVIPDTATPGRLSVQLRTPCAGGDCFIAYTNLEQVPAGIVAGATIARGQVIGVAGTQPPQGGAAIFAMIHFQIADPAAASNGTSIVSPETYFTPAAKAAIDQIWRTAMYINEWCEPFMTNSRAVLFPMARTWTRTSGDGPAQLTIACVDNPSGYTYTFLNADGSTSEAGALQFGWAVRPNPTADFVSAGGSRRLAVYDILNGTMQMAIAPPGVFCLFEMDCSEIYTTK